MEIDILINDEYQDDVSSGYLEKITRVILENMHGANACQLGIVITGDEEIRQLNREYRGIDSTTDVLAFAMQDETVCEDEHALLFPLHAGGVRQLGEVLISFPQAVRQAEEAGHDVQKEIVTLVVHGILHLLGFDHETDEEAEVMESREAELLAKMEGLAQ